jgi:predicted Zn-ribbon and HTH transcriptional regulator
MYLQKDLCKRIVIAIPCCVFYPLVVHEEGLVPRVPITVMGYRCELCSHEWIPSDAVLEPVVCPKCKSPNWDRPRRKGGAMLTYEDFREKVRETLKKSDALTWTEIRTAAKLPQKFPNNKWVRQLEQDVGLKRGKDAHGIIKWKIG